MATQIHHRRSVPVDEWVTDPDMGLVLKRSEKLMPNTADNLSVGKGTFASTPEGGTYQPDEDGTFTVPEDVAADMVKHHPHWYAGPSPFARAKETPPAPTKAVAPPAVSSAK
jgi:hypothetical protein